MAKRVSAAVAKATLAELMAEVAYAGQRVVIEKRGKPLVALISIDDLLLLQERQGISSRPLGALALLGAGAEVGLTDEQIDEMVKDIYASRDRDTGAQVDLSDLIEPQG